MLKWIGLWEIKVINDWSLETCKHRLYAPVLSWLIYSFFLNQLWCELERWNVCPKSLLKKLCSNRLNFVIYLFLEEAGIARNKDIGVLLDCGSNCVI